MRNLCPRDSSPSRQVSGASDSMSSDWFGACQSRKGGAPGASCTTRALAMAVVCDVHPLGNLRVLQYLQNQLGVADAQKTEWSRHWIATGFAALEAMLADSEATGRFCHGDSPTLADVCLVPQIYNAHRWQVPMEDYPTLRCIDTACSALDAFRRAAPEAQDGAA